MQNTESLTFVKSSFSGGNGACVEVAVTADGGRAVRDSKDQGKGPIHRYTHAEWAAFVAGVKAGEFDA
ncbi:DUF397 domain-containing protein [Streptomyces sp. NPDC005708]|uniref:DUF397 domain-containing protein n=1 Tax=Streptomyces sp. NPDC005708 TaxID=3154564 RepID=UPI0033C83D27